MRSVPILPDADAERALLGLFGCEQQVGAGCGTRTKGADMTDQSRPAVGRITELSSAVEFPVDGTDPDRKGCSGEWVRVSYARVALRAEWSCGVVAEFSLGCDYFAGTGSDGEWYSGLLLEDADRIEMKVLPAPPESTRDL